MPKYTLVQHSAVLTGHAEFTRALEAASIDNAATERKIKAAGGLIYDGYWEADTAAEELNYPPGNTGLVPRIAAGRFDDSTRLGGRALYIPAEPLTVAGFVDGLAAGGSTNLTED